MAYPSRGLGESIRSITGVSQVFPFRSSPGVASMRPGGFFVPAAPVPGAVVRTGPSNEDVLKAVYGSVEKGQAAQQASIDEARQRQAELMAQAQRDAPPVNYVEPPPAFDVGPSPSPNAALQPGLVPEQDEDAETEGDVIEEVAEGSDEGDSEFSGWGCGLGERRVGVAFTRRETSRMDHVRLRDKRRKAMKAERRAHIRKFLKPGVHVWRT